MSIRGGATEELRDKRTESHERMVIRAETQKSRFYSPFLEIYNTVPYYQPCTLLLLTLLVKNFFPVAGKGMIPMQ